MKTFLILPLLVLFTGRFAVAEESYDCPDWVAGSYSVPVSPDLEPYSHYQVDTVCLSRKGNALSVAYLVPEELTGAANPIVLRGTDSGGLRFSLESADGSADCSRDGNDPHLVQCDIRYEKLALNKETNLELLKKRFPDPREFAARLEVATKFSGEPHGILSFRLTSGQQLRP